MAVAARFLAPASAAVTCAEVISRGPGDRGAGRAPSVGQAQLLLSIVSASHQDGSAARPVVVLIVADLLTVDVHVLPT